MTVPKQLVAVALASALWGGAARATDGATTCRALQFSFTSDCLRAPGDAACAWHADKPDLGPQIAVWVESADRARFVDTLMVTNATALYGIGNRPGLPNLRSGPKFPYGRRPMVLPVWAHARGKTYPLVVMQDGQEGLLTYHEGDSSPEPHFCCPMLPDQEVDAITCPSAAFRSDKGRLDATQTSVYPPRGDLFDLGTTCPVLVNHPEGSCNVGDSRQYAFLDDVDTISAATPPFGVATQGTWTIPDDLALGDYALMVEVSKEFDTNATYAATNAPSLDYDTFGTVGNLGQPSVVYRVPFSVGATGVAGGGAAAAMFGYGDVTGATGAIAPPDVTITSAPGSGEGRLATTTGADGAGRVHVSFASCAPVDCATEGAPPTVPISVGGLAPTDASVQIEQVGDGQPGEDHAPVMSYEIRVAPLARDGAVDITPEDFVSWAAESSPTPAAPGTLSDVTLAGLTPSTAYGVGVVAHGSCGSSSVTFARFTTPGAPAQDSHLSGCFIATAAFGSDVAPEVAALRRVRDAAVAASGFARLAAELYYAAAPAAARVLRDTDVGRAAVRAPLRPLARVGAAVARRL
ncbi:MAG TPA: CFI-box-CTERM domain-containing protein [Polyangia bacterium]|nr:CFI-box-CTERM domain-containing protein [Polyangia bacterium]